MAAVIGSMLKNKDRLGANNKKKRIKVDRSQLELVPHVSNVYIKPFPKFAPKWLTGKAAQEALQAKAAHETIKKMLIGKELLHQKSKASFDALSQVSYNDNDDGSSKNGFSNAYSAIYIGLILMCIGAVITFVGLGEKGFKTLELKLIGPILGLVGFTCITLKIIQCTFPQLFQLPSFLSKNKSEEEKDSSNLMEKGQKVKQMDKEAQLSRSNGNGHLSDLSAKNSPQFLSPRVTLQSKKPNRPKSTIPNYIEDTSEDEDDFDPGRTRPHSNRYNSVTPINNQSQQLETRQQQLNTEENNKTNSQSDFQKSPKPSEQKKVQQKNNEIVLNPNALQL